MQSWVDLLVTCWVITGVLLILGGLGAILSWHVGSSGGIVFSTMCFFGCFMGFMISMVMTANYNKSKQEWTHHVVDILSLDRDTGVYGRFTMGSGTVEDKPVYYYYYQVRENTYKLGKVNCNDCYLIETDERTPSIWEVKEKGKLEPYYNVYVPFGTVVVSYVA